MAKLISNDYQQILKTKHNEDPEWGNTAFRWGDRVFAICDKYCCGTILDYGCGKATLAEYLQNSGCQAVIQSYDPGIDERNIDCDMADLAVCIDVMEHVERDYVDAVIEHIASLTNTVAFFVISTSRAAHLLPDGRNAHITIEGGEFWASKIRNYFKIVEYSPDGCSEIIILAEKNNG